MSIEADLTKMHHSTFECNFCGHGMSHPSESKLPKWENTCILTDQGMFHSEVCRCDEDDSYQLLPTAEPERF